MTPILSETSGYLLIFCFGVAMVALTILVSRDKRWKTTGIGFLVAGRDVPGTVGALSIAASWIWAPALFVSVQVSYQMGLAGLFWFVAPNILALVVFAFLAPRIRDSIPGGFTLPDWINHRFENRLLHRLYMVPYIWYQVMAICVQIFVGGMMLNFLTGINLNILMLLILLIGLSYSLISGLRASIMTDFIQMLAIFVGLAVVITWILIKVPDGAVTAGLAGVNGSVNIFTPSIAFSFGIVTSIGLIAGAISDQQYWQRSFAIRKDKLVFSFAVGGFLFGLVPISLSVLGFLAANPAMGIEAPQTGLPMIGIATVATLLPKGAVVFFVIMLLSGLCSTLDSGLCAASSLYAIDMAKLTPAQQKVLRKQRLGETLDAADREHEAVMNLGATKNARVAMFGIAFIGFVVALIVQHLFSLTQLWWIFNGVASCFVVPTVLSVFWKGLTAKGAITGILCSLLGMVLFIYGNWTSNNPLIVYSAIGIVAINFACCFFFRDTSR